MTSKCLCCGTAVEADILCINCLQLLSAVILHQEREVVASFWDVTKDFERARTKLKRSFERSPFEPEAAIGCAFGFVRTAKVDDGLCLAALCLARDPNACWGCIAPGKVLADPVAMRFERLDELRAFISEDTVAGI